mgnify:CR=1 FL=1
MLKYSIFSSSGQDFNVAKSIGDERPSDEENARFWTVLYVGKNANKDEEGSYVWKLPEYNLSATTHQL